IRDEVMTTELGQDLTASIEDGLSVIELMLDAERLIREDEDVVVASKVEELRLEVDDVVSVAITELQEVIVTQAAAAAIDRFEMTASIKSDTTAQITALRQTFVAADQSIAASQEQLISRVGDAEAIV